MKTYIVTNNNLILTDLKVDAFPTGRGKALHLSGKNIHDAVAKATWGGANIRGVDVESGYFTKMNQFAYVSGLTSCIGIIMAQKDTSESCYKKICVAHYNDHWNSTAGMEDQIKFFGKGLIYGFIITYNRSEDVDKLKVESQRRLNNVGIDDNKIMLYCAAHNRKWDSLSFGVCADCTIGEIHDPYITVEAY